MVYHASILLFLLLKITNGESPWHSPQYSNFHESRHELVVVDAVSDQNFTAGEHVYRWRNIRVGKRDYAIGLMGFQVTILVSEESKDEMKFQTASNVFNLETLVTDVALFKNWNNVLRENEVVCIISTGSVEGNLLWFKVFGNATLRKISSWNVNQKIEHLNFFKHDRKYKLLTISTSESLTSADIYEFQYNSHLEDFWHIQRLHIANPTNSTTITNLGPNYFLSIPQNSLNLVLVYKFLDNHFQPFTNISCSQATNVISFNIYSKAYLAVAGDDGGIFRFTKSTLIKETIDDDLYGVNFWYPIPVRTFRNDLLLLAQRTLEHDSHTSLSLVLFLQQQGTFIYHDDVTCVYHGETTSGLGCLVDDDRVDGVVGMVVVSSGKSLGCLVPRERGPSAMIMLDVVLKEVPNPVEEQMEKFSESRRKLQKLLQDRQERAFQAQRHAKNRKKMMEENLIEATLNQGMKRQATDNLELKNLQNKLMDIKRQIAEMKENLEHRMDISVSNKTIYYNTIIFNGDVKVTGRVDAIEVFADNIYEEDAQKVIEDIVMKDNIKPIQSSKIFTNLSIGNLITKTIDGLPASDLIFNDENPIQIKGDLIFTAPVRITNDLISTTGKINDLILENEVVQPEKIHHGALKFREIKVMGVVQASRVEESLEFLDVFSIGQTGHLPDLMVDSFDVPLNVTVTNVNGINFNKFLDSLILKNIKSHIRGDVSFSGPMIVFDDSHTNYLNGLKFPEEYFFVSPPRLPIKGVKTFVEPLGAKSMGIYGKFNDIDPQKLICLDRERIISKTVTFADLEVSEKFDYKGKLIGPRTAAAENPTLMEADRLASNINFQDLEITGKIIVSNVFNNINFTETLEDIVYTDELNPKITSQKTFTEGLTVLESTKVKTDTINRIPTESFITKNTEQILNINKLNASVIFENLFISGIYRGFNITKLIEETVKTYGDQYVSANIVFLNEPNVPGITVTNTLNQIDVKDFITTKDISKQLKLEDFEEINADTVIVEGNAFVNISNFDLDSFDSRRVSLSKHQVINASYSIEEVEADWLLADLINGRPRGYLLETRNFAQEIANKLHAGQLRVKELYINGSLVMDEMNGFDLDTLMMKGSWRGRILESGSNLLCQRNITFGQLHFESFNGVRFYDFAKTLVYKTEPYVELSGFNVFNNGFTVEKYIDTDKINGIYVDNILRNTGEQTVLGPIGIKGNVVISCPTRVTGNLNGVSLGYISDTFILIENGYLINGDVYFDRIVYINGLFINNFVNEVYMPEYLTKIVNKNGDYNFTGSFVFEKEVNITGNLATSNINGIDLNELESSAVLLTNDAEIEGVVRFQDFVLVNNRLKIHGDFYSKYLDGVNLEDWKIKATYIDRGLIYGNFTFDNVDIEEYLVTSYINNVNTNDLITTNTEQHIPGNIKFGEVAIYNNIPVGNLVNGIKFDNFLDSILINETDQEIPSDITFTNNVLIYDSLKTEGTINGIHLDKLVTTSTDQNLSAIYHFTGENYMEEEIYVHNLMNDIDVTDWFSNALKKSSAETQIINSEIDVDGDLNFMKDVKGDGLINNLSFPLIAETLEEKKGKKYELEKGIVDGYEKVCSDVNFVMHFARNQIFSFKYFEDLQVLTFPSPVTNVYNFMNNGTHYLLASEEADCMSHIFVWTKNDFKYSSSHQMGLIFQVISIKKLDATYFVTLSPEDPVSCGFTGANIWRVVKNTVKHLYKLDNILLLQESQLRGTFYVYGEEGVIEYRFNPKKGQPLRKHRKWLMQGDNLAFVPRGLQTGLAMRNGEKIFRLTSDNLVITDDQSDSVYIGSIEEIENPFIPGRIGGETAVMRVGSKYEKRTLIAVTTHDETRVTDSLDLIKIHDDFFTGSLFQNVAVHNPSSPVFVDFGNGESLLLFLENQRVLQVFEYKGIEGFKHRSSSNIEGEKLFVIELPLKPYKNTRQVIGVINGNEIKFLESVMIGNHFEGKEFDCRL